MSVLRFLLVLTVFLGVKLHAQGAGEGKDHKIRGRAAIFVCAGFPKGMDNPITIQTGKDMLSLQLSVRSASEPVEIPADGVIRIVRESDDDEEEYKTIGQVKLPDGVKRALVILVPKGEGRGNLTFDSKVFRLNASEGGGRLFVNVSPVDIKVQIGDKEIELKPEEMESYSAGSLGEATSLPVQYRFYNEQKKTWDLLSASTIAVRGTRLELCIFSWNPERQRVQYHGITCPASLD